MIRILLFLSCATSFSLFSQKEIRTEIRSIENDELISLFTSGYNKQDDEISFNQEFGIEEVHVVKEVRDSVVFDNDTLKVRFTQTNFSNGEFTKDSIVTLKLKNGDEIKREYQIQKVSGLLIHNFIKEGHSSKGILNQEIYFKRKMIGRLAVVEKKVMYAYEDDLLTEKQTYYFTESKFKLVSTELFSYNPRNLKEKSEFLYNGGGEKKLTFYTYDSLNRLVEEKVMFNQQESISRFIYSNRENGQKKESSTFKNGI